MESIPSYANQLGDQRPVPEVLGSDAKWAQIGGNGVFRGETVEKDIEMKKKMWDTVTYMRMLTDERQVPNIIGSGAKMAQVGGNGVFCVKTVEKDMEIN